MLNELIVQLLQRLAEDLRQLPSNQILNPYVKWVDDFYAYQDVFPDQVDTELFHALYGFLDTVFDSVHEYRLSDFSWEQVEKHLNLAIAYFQSNPDAQFEKRPYLLTVLNMY